MDKTITEACMYIVGLFIGFAFLYGAYWLLKNGSYWLWYEEMVKETIKELVKTEALK